VIKAKNDYILWLIPIGMLLQYAMSMVIFRNVTLMMLSENKNVFDVDFTVKTETEFNWNRAFTGQIVDVETGQMLYRNRYYNIEFGRFVSRDPIEYDAEDVNLFRYVLNTSINKNDSSGTTMGKGESSPQYHGIDPYEKPKTQTLPDSLDAILSCVPSDCSCSAGDLNKLLQEIQDVIDQTRIFPLLPGPCQRWANKFACSVASGSGSISPSPCLKNNSGMLWEPYMIVGGHAYFEFEICGGTVIRVENHARNMGKGQYTVILPENCDKCPKK
jgi:RHS repeat-associated protein